MSKESERVTFYEARGNEVGPMRFRRVEVRYADGSPFYRGWIRDFGDGRTGPTFFPQNYENYDLDREEVHKRDEFWQPMKIEDGALAIREAEPGDLDNIIDLNFQNYFDGGYNRISAYQGLHHNLDADHTTIVATVNGKVFGFLYIDWAVRKPRKEVYFDNLYCAPAVRRRGLAHRVIAAGVCRAKQRGIKGIVGQINGDEEHNVQVARMLMKHGFEVVESVENGPDWIETAVYRSL